MKTLLEDHGGAVFDDGPTLEGGPGDHFVVPGWHRHRREAGAGAVLFSYSDRVVQNKPGLWRRERGDP